MGKLTTHVLDIYNGHPAANMTVELWQIHKDGSRQRVLTTQTNTDGRCDAPLLADDSMEVGEYELHFNVRYYYAVQKIDCPFLNVVPIRFTLFDVEAHYHVPLLVSPWAYNTYRGS